MIKRNLAKQVFDRLIVCQVRLRSTISLLIQFNYFDFPKIMDKPKKVEDREYRFVEKIKLESI